MNDERQEFLNMKTYPARLNTQEAAWFLGFASHDMPIMIRAGLLKPLGNPPSNGVKILCHDNSDHVLCRS